MKIKKYSTIYILFLFAIGLLISCNSEDDLLTGVNASVSDKFETKVQFISNLKDATLTNSSSDVNLINTYISNNIKNESNYWLTILDRADNSSLSQIMTIPMEHNKWSSFAMNRMKNKTSYEGSILIYNDPSRLVNSNSLGGYSFVTGLSPKMKGVRTDKDENGAELEKVDISFNANFYTVRFENESQIVSFGGEMGVMNTIKRENMNLLLIGTVKNNLFKTLQEKVSETDGTFKTTSIIEGSEYTIFMLNEERFWGFRDVKTTSISSDITAYEISLMW